MSVLFGFLQKEYNTCCYQQKQEINHKNNNVVGRSVHCMCVANVINTHKKRIYVSLLYRIRGTVKKFMDNLNSLQTIQRDSECLHI